MPVNLGRKTGRPAEIVETAPELDLTLRCESCDGVLAFLHTVVGGVTIIEQWDRYACRHCRTAFEYRRRTRKLRRVS